MLCFNQRSFLVQFNLLKLSEIITCEPLAFAVVRAVCHGSGKDDPRLRSDSREKGEQLPVIAFDFAFVKTTPASGETELKDATTLVAVDADLFLVKNIHLLGKETADYTVTGVINFIEGSFTSTYV